MGLFCFILVFCVCSGYVLVLGIVCLFVLWFFWLLFLFFVTQIVVCIVGYPFLHNQQKSDVPSVCCVLIGPFFKEALFLFGVYKAVVLEISS